MHRLTNKTLAEHRKFEWPQVKSRLSLRLGFQLGAHLNDIASGVVKLEQNPLRCPAAPPHINQNKNNPKPDSGGEAEKCGRCQSNDQTHQARYNKADSRLA